MGIFSGSAAANPPARSAANQPTRTSLNPLCGAASSANKPRSRRPSPAPKSGANDRTGHAVIVPNVRPAMRQAIKVAVASSHECDGAPRPARAQPLGHGWEDWRRVRPRFDRALTPCREGVGARRSWRSAGLSSVRWEIPVPMFTDWPASLCPGSAATLPENGWRPATCVSWGRALPFTVSSTRAEIGGDGGSFRSLYIERYIHQAVKHRINSGLRPILI